MLEPRGTEELVEYEHLLLPRAYHTWRGNEHILVLSDYTTRYPEAIPLRRFTAPVVAERLIKVFARYVIPQEILTDQGTNFTSSHPSC